MVTLRFASVLLLAGTLAACGGSDDRRVRLACTTSTQNSGLIAHLLDEFAKVSDIEVLPIAVGTGQAIAICERGDADLLLVHHRASEDRFVADGHGIERHDVMHNDFVILGPANDPARIRGLDVPTDALTRIAERDGVFVSRGDESGTHRREQELWQAAGVDPTTWPSGRYLRIGAGMGATLNVAVAKSAYVLADRGTWLAFGNKRTHAILVAGHARLRNPYGLILVNPARHPHVRVAEARTFAQWLLGPSGQAAIAAFRIEGAQAFFARAP